MGEDAWLNKINSLGLYPQGTQLSKGNRCIISMIIGINKV